MTISHVCPRAHTRSQVQDICCFGYGRSPFSRQALWPNVNLPTWYFALLHLLNANMILLASLLLISLQLLLHVGSTLKYLSVHCSSHLGMQNGNPSKTNSKGSTPCGRHKIPLSRGIHLVFEILLTYVLHASSWGIPERTVRLSQ